MSARVSGYRKQTLKGGSFGRPQSISHTFDTPDLADMTQRNVQYGIRCGISISGNEN